MARSPNAIARRVARSVLEEILDHPHWPEVRETDPTLLADRLLGASLKVTRANTRDHGEVVIITFVVPRDDTDDVVDAVIGDESS